jgi:hypothetical protein
MKALAELLKTPKRVAVMGADTVGFAVLAGMSNDSKTLQVLISNHEVPKALKPLHPTPALNFKRAPLREIEYKDNRGYKLVIDRLPWGNSQFTLKRYRLDQNHDLAQVENRTSRGNRVELSNDLPPPGIELITLRKR